MKHIIPALARARVFALLFAVLSIAGTASAYGGSHWSAWAHRPWQPRDVPNATAYYATDSGITIATGVSVWADQLGSGNNLVQATGANQPVVTTNALNGHSCITADGINDSLTGLYTVGVARTIVLVGRYNTAYSAISSLLDAASGNQGRLFRTAATTATMFAGSGFAITGITPTNFHYHTLLFNGASSLYQEDGVQRGSGTTSSAPPSGITLFAFGSGGSDWANASICEVVVISRAVTSQEYGQIEFFEKAKFSL